MVANLEGQIWESAMPGILKMCSSETEPNVSFLELRKLIQDAEVLSPEVERLLKALDFTGRLTVVVQNGRVLKSGYEEGYFTRRWDVRSV